jgi:predicted esterase
VAGCDGPSPAAPGRVRRLSGDEREIRVRRTARFCVRGAAGGAGVPAPRELWVACHGYAQLARYFIRSFEAIDDGTRLIVAPEALNRFYAGRAPGEPAHRSRVGGTWMTREARDHDIADYVAYLDDVVAHLRAEGLDPDLPAVALGFSQGAATVSRWAALGNTRLRHLVLWGAGVAHDLELRPDVFGGAELLLVAGTADPQLDAARVTSERARLHEAGLPHALVEYDGGHAIDPVALADVATRLRA